jgi:acetolactate synthase-1/2/3 large subunit
MASGKPALIELRLDPEALTPAMSLSAIRAQSLAKRQS